MLKVTYMNKSIFKENYKENDRLIDGEKADYARSCRRQILAAFLASLMSFSSGTVISGWTPTKGRPKDKDLTKWPIEEESWIISIYVFGALLGALPAGFLSQKYGRKCFLLWLALPMTVGWLICLVELNNLTMQCFGRFLCGISVGATTVAIPLYASDVSSDVLRGRTGVFLDFMLCAGIQYGYVVRMALTSLRQFCLACAVVPLAFVSLFWFMPESPTHLYNNSRYEDAVAALRWLRGRRFNIKNEFEKMERIQWNNDGRSLELGRKMSDENRKVFVKVLTVSFGLVLCQRLSGAGGVIQYTSELFNISGSTINSNVACIIVGAFQLIASGVSFSLIDKIGRRTLLLISSAAVTTCLVLLIIYFSLLNKGVLEGSPWKISVLFILCIFISTFRLGLGPIPWFMNTELMPVEYRDGYVQSMTSSFSWFLSFFITKSFKILVEKNSVLLWSSFATFSFVGFFFILFYVPETNNKSREQIRKHLIG